MKNRLHVCSMFLATMLLVACETIGLPVPNTFNEKLATGYVTVTTVRTKTTALLGYGVITIREAENIQKQADTVREGLDIARSLHDQYPQAGKDKLEATLLILNTLNNYVVAKEGDRR